MTARRTSPLLGWPGIFRLGLVQASIGALVVVTTSMLNRIQVVELALPAVLPGVLVAIHYFVQVLRPRFGYGSDVGGRRTPWIIGGMAVLAAGALGATWATTLMPTDFALGVALAVVSFIVVGLGVGACGTSLLVLLSTSIAPARLAAAATVTWVMMIAGFIVTTVVVGKLLDPFSLARLVEVTAVVAAGAFLVTCIAVAGVERDRGVPDAVARAEGAGAAPPADFRAALREVWAEPHSRRLAGFVFVSMLAYSAQDLVLEPFAGAVFGLTPAQSTRLSGMQSGGVLVGMLLVATMPPKPKATACAAPQRPMRVPSREPRPRPTRPIIEPMAATAKAPLARPSANTSGRSACAAPATPATAISASIAAEPRQPAMVQPRSDPNRERAPAVQIVATSNIPTSTPLLCMPDRRVDSAGVSPNTAPANGSSTRSCAL